MSDERVAYWIARTVVAVAGLVVLVIAIVLPGRTLSPSIAQRILGLTVGLPLGALMLCPNRLTISGRRFKFRLVASILVGLPFIAAGLAAIPAGFDGQQDPRVWVCVPILLPIGLCLPGCLWWRSRLAARKGAPRYQEL
jgi:hypothetical protein